MTAFTKQRAVLCDNHIDWVYRTKTHRVGIKDIEPDES